MRIACQALKNCSGLPSPALSAGEPANVPGSPSGKVTSVDGVDHIISACSMSLAARLGGNKQVQAFFDGEASAKRHPFAHEAADGFAGAQGFGAEQVFDVGWQVGSDGCLGLGGYLVDVADDNELQLHPVAPRVIVVADASFPLSHSPCLFYNLFTISGTVTSEMPLELSGF